jgi:hypothetical protein
MMQSKRNKERALDTVQLLRYLKAIPGYFEPVNPGLAQVYKHQIWRDVVKQEGYASLEYSKAMNRPKHPRMAGKDTVRQVFAEMDRAGAEAALQIPFEVFNERRYKGPRHRVCEEEDYQRLQEIIDDNLKFHGCVNEYRYKEGKTCGRITSGRMQSIPTELRGLLFRHTTDVDMSNAHPRILEWMCHMNDIACPLLSAFIADREGVYKHYPSRAEAKVALLKMVNNHSPSKDTPAALQPLEDELWGIRMSIIGLPQYANLKATSDDTKGNLVGSWVNAAICRHENEMLLAAVDHLENSRGIQAALLMYDGVMVYGDHYAEEEEVCGALEKVLQDKFQIRMPFAMKPHSTVFHDLIEEDPVDEEPQKKKSRRELWSVAWQKARKEMATLATLDKAEAERLHRKFHRCGHSAEQQLNEARRAVKDKQVHAHVSFDIETCAVEGKHRAYAIAGTVRGGESQVFTVNDGAEEEDIAKRFLDWCMEQADKRYGHADIQAKRNRTVVMQAHNLSYDTSGIKHLLSRFDLVEKQTDIYGGTARYKLPDSDYTGNDRLAAWLVSKGMMILLDGHEGRRPETVGVAARAIRAHPEYVTLENAASVKGVGPAVWAVLEVAPWDELEPTPRVVGKRLGIVLRDTYKFVSKPLRDFGKMFNLPMQKEYMPHGLMTTKFVFGKERGSGGGSSARPSSAASTRCCRRPSPASATTRASWPCGSS